MLFLLYFIFFSFILFCFHYYLFYSLRCAVLRKAWHLTARGDGRHGTAGSLCRSGGRKRGGKASRGLRIDRGGFARTEGPCLTSIDIILRILFFVIIIYFILFITV